MSLLIGNQDDVGRGVALRDLGLNKLGFHTSDVWLANTNLTDQFLGINYYKHFMIELGLINYLIRIFF